MLVRIQHYNFQMEELPEVSCEQAQHLFQRIDWAGELARWQEARRFGYQVCAPGMELTDDTGTRLFLSPVDAGTICFNYVFHAFHSEFGLCQMDREEEKYVANYPLDSVNRLIVWHYRSDRGKILQVESGSGAPRLTLPADGSGSGRP